MRKILTSFSLVAASLAFAQVGINADQNDIAGDAVFHVENKSGEAKGVILPSVSLTAADDQTTITGAGGNVTKGLLVWNDGESALKPAGYYYWDGVKWLLTGNVDSGSSEAPKLDGITGKVQILPSPVVASEIDADTFAVIVTGTVGANIALPDPALFPGRVLAVNNQSGSIMSFTGSYTPANTNSVESGAGFFLIAFQDAWYLIGGIGA